MVLSTAKQYDRLNGFGAFSNSNVYVEEDLIVNDDVIINDDLLVGDELTTKTLIVTGQSTLDTVDCSRISASGSGLIGINRYLAEDQMGNTIVKSSSNDTGGAFMRMIDGYAFELIVDKQEVAKDGTVNNTVRIFEGSLNDSNQLIFNVNGRVTSSELTTGDINTNGDITITGHSNALRFIDNGDDRDYYIGYTSNNNETFDTSDYLMFGKGSTIGSNIAMVINDTNVGIGTSTPGTGFEVHTGSAISTFYDTTLDTTMLLSSATTAGENNFGASLGFSRIDSSTRIGSTISIVQTSTDADQCGLAFHTHPYPNTGNNLVEAMRIQHDGNVGIGTTTPSQKLHVAGNVSCTDLICNNIKRTGGTVELSTITSGDIRLDPAGDIDFYYNNVNNCGTITVVGENGVKFWSGTNDRDYYIGYRSDLDGNTDTSDYLMFGKGLTFGSNIAMVINDTNIGIGTTTPSAKLHVNGEVRVGLVPAVVTNTEFYARYTTNALYFNRAGPSYVDQLGPGGSTHFRIEDIEKMRITSTGIGIGNVSPSALLHIARSSSAESHMVIIENSGTGDANIGFKVSNSNFWTIGVDNNGSDSFEWNYNGTLDGAHEMRLTFDGNLNIRGTYSNFTGSHRSNNLIDIEPGLIVRSVGTHDNTTDISNTYVDIELCDTYMDKTVAGVFNKAEDTYTMINANGEGKVWVTNIMGSVSNGDYITSSTVPGYGCIQADDIKHSYTVAKCVTTQDWENPGRYVDSSGNVIDEATYLLDTVNNYKAILVGCYYCL